MKNLETIKMSIKNEMMNYLLKLNYVDTIIHKKGYDIWNEFLCVDGDVYVEIKKLYEKYDGNIFLFNKDVFWMKKLFKYFKKYKMSIEEILPIFNDIVDNWLKERWDDEKERVLEMTLIDDTIYNEGGFIIKEMSKVSKKKINSILNNLNKK
jgi:hypothetical protein